MDCGRFKKPTELTRKELYDLVWSEPVSKVAKRFDISDVGLKKICRKNDIPVPNRGYWARKYAGQKVRQAPLPNPSMESTVFIYGNQYSYSERKPRKISVEYKTVESILNQSRTETVPPHPLIEHTAAIMGRVKVTKDGILQAPKAKCLDIEVSPASLRRSIEIMASILNALSRLGHQVLLSEDGTAVKINDSEIYFGITEDLAKMRLKPHEHDLSGYYEFGYKLYSENSIPTGSLCLFTRSGRWNEGIRKKWRDTETKKVEDLIGNFLKKILNFAE